MCYHVKQTTSLDILAQELGIDKPKGNHELYFQPQNEITGFSFPWVPVVTDENPDQMKIAKWGLMLPGFPSFKDQVKRFNTLNAKSENYVKPRSVTSQNQTRRATMLVDGFYEWQHVSVLGEKKKNRFLMTMPRGESFHLACIYRDWFFPEFEREIKTVSIITCAANTLMSHIHNTKKRMPVILNSEFASHWLNGDLEVKDFKEMTGYFEDLPLDATRR